MLDVERDGLAAATKRRGRSDRFFGPITKAGTRAALLAVGLAGCASSPAATNPAPAAPAQTTEQMVPPVATDTQPDPMMGESMVMDPSLDTVRAGRFDNGRMWTFEYPPTAYFQSAYGFAPDSTWLRTARLGALRIPGCSASFVSPNGLVMTNHHCGREHVTAVSGEGESLLDDGFYAAALSDERQVPEFEGADQLVEIVDITDEVYSALEGATDAGERAQIREATLEAIQERVLAAHGGEEAGMHVETISLYQGGRYSAYVFRRYTDVRLVMTPELAIGYFGGDPDNFTYPRYSLDMTFFRVYDEGRPLDTSDAYFRFSEEGVQEGDVVFVIGNPGSTSRIQTVSELLFRRDVSDKALLEFLDSRIEALEESITLDPVDAEKLDLRNDVFSLLNSQKSYRGMIAGLHDPAILAKRRDGERQFREAIEADPALMEQYGGLIDRMAEIQTEKAGVAPGFGAFLALTSPEYASATLTRAVYAFQYVQANAGGAPPEVTAGLKEELLGVRQQGVRLEEILIEARLQDLVRSYGLDDSSVQSVLAGRTPEGAATVIVQNSVLSDSARTAAAVEDGSLQMTDAGIQVILGMLGVLGPFQQVVTTVGDEEAEIAASLGRARFEVYGSDVPPDATFSLRIADGVVRPYEYNGTSAPIVTTFYGLYDRHYSFSQGANSEAWALPDRWLQPPSDFDLSTPMNFVSTADIVGGNSGSPIVNRNLEVVGLAFDGNIESLPGEYIFTEETARTVAVDARGILEALKDLYGADRIADEIRSAARAGR